MPDRGRPRQHLTTELERLKSNARDRRRDKSFSLSARWNDSHDRVDYLYRSHELIASRSDVDEILGALARVGEAPPTSTHDGPVGLTILDLGDRDAAQVADSIAEVIGDDVATLNHVLDVQSGHYLMCPATEALPWYGPVETLGEPIGQGKARVAVIDTGFSPKIASESGFDRFSAVSYDNEIDDEVYFPDSTKIRPYGGHGTAATAQLLAISGADSVTVRVADCLVGGAVDEITIVEDLERIVNSGVDIISIQAGLYSRRGTSPKAFNAFRRQVLSKHPDVVIVAAAGNNGSDYPFWPAAYDWTTAVGALTYGGDARAGWTNYGYWVDVYASGENRVVPYPNGTYEYLTDTTAEFTQGHALWSGTSFAAPVVAGMIARRMIERNISASQARDIVLDEAATNALPTTGPRVLG